MIFSSGEGLLGCFPVLATVNRVAVKMAEEESVQKDAESLGHMSRNGKTKSPYNCCQKFDNVQYIIICNYDSY